MKAEETGCSYEQYSLAVFFKVTRKYLAVLLIGAVMPRFFFTFLFRIKLNYKINENNCIKCLVLQNNTVYL